MNPSLADLARACITGAHTGTMTFPAIVGALMEAGFEAYQVDFRAGTATYYLPSGECVTLAAGRPAVAPTAMFDAEAVAAAVRQAQAGGPEYTYDRFCERVARAGCAGYLVSFPGRRVAYLGRTGEVHTEHFPPGN